MANILGIQFTAMNFSNVDSNLTECVNYFNKEGYSFVLKPVNLRSVPIIIKTVDPNPPSYSFAPRTIESRYIRANI